MYKEISVPPPDIIGGGTPTSPAPAARRAIAVTHR
jgi:hypothetical protein